ncbi:hypothetical protein HAX54_047388 [Datura stramonium]|uniref:Uncharacterized protein n=1 Tax=Datura stramonium TaxID=4076 RepID=A0ABS8WK93_DATST|nr:hypothetical protein [Datura stramonium]
MCLTTLDMYARIQRITYQNEEQTDNEFDIRDNPSLTQLTKIVNQTKLANGQSDDSDRDNLHDYREEDDQLSDEADDLDEDDTPIHPEPELEPRGGGGNRYGRREASHHLVDEDEVGFDQQKQTSAYDNISLYHPVMNIGNPQCETSISSGISYYPSMDMVTPVAASLGFAAFSNSPSLNQFRGAIDNIFDYETDSSTQNWRQ